MSGRLHKSLLNVRVSLLFYFLSMFLAFFSRKVFLDCLGAEFIGLTGTLGNILGYLNLAELGIGSCISFFLFGPIERGDRRQIGEILSLFGWLYRRVGLALLGGGVLVSLFFPIIFGGASTGLGIAYFAFYSFLGSSLIGYFINYRQILLGADQKGYLVNVYFQSAALVKTAMQIGLALWWGNVWVWVAVEFVFGIIGCVVLNRKIDREYPWLHCDKSRGRELLRKYPDVLPNTRRVFIHQIKDFLLFRSDELFVFAFVSLRMVAYYGNYTILVTKLLQFVNSAFDSIGASVGNLVAEGDKANMLKVFWELMSVRHFIAGVICFGLYSFAEPFIGLWLGPGYVLPHGILVLLSVNAYIIVSRSAVDMFNHAHGLYADVWSAWTELALNIGVTFSVGWHYGLYGILLGKIVSTLLIVVVWKPMYLFRSGFRLPYAGYWRGTLPLLLSFAIAFAAGRGVLAMAGIGLGHWGGLVATMAVGTAAYTATAAGTLLLTAQGARDFAQRLRGMRTRQTKQ